MRRELERIEIPGEHEARLRAWEVVQAAYESREPVPRRGRRARPLLAAAAAAGLLAAAVTPPGRALIAEVREAIGVEGSAPALFRLPAEGRLLVTSDAGAWVVASDGSTRLLGPYAEASWSPFGRFVVAARKHELATLEPDGDVRWTLGRPDVRFPRWGGSRTDTRIAYLSGSELRVVAGDGTGDRRLAPAAGPAAPAWRPGDRHELAYADRLGRVLLVDADSGSVLWRASAGGAVSQLGWSTDGRRLLARRTRFVDVYDAAGEPATGVRVPGGTITAASFRPGGHGIAVAVRRGARSELFSTGGGTLLSGPGIFTDLAWSPDGRWLLAGWREAGQWVFVGVGGTRRVEAVSGLETRFRASTFPRVEGWCCASR